MPSKPTPKLAAAIAKAEAGSSSGNDIYAPCYIALTIPPSANNLFPTGAGGKRYKSIEYRAWLAEAGMLLAARKPRRFDQPVKVTYELSRPADNRRRDLANLEKGLSDLLVSHNVLADDSLIHEFTMRWVYGRPPREAVVIIEQLP